LAFVAFLGAGVSTLFTRTGGLLSRAGLFAFAFAFALALGGTDLRFFGGALTAFAGGFVERLALAFGAADLRFFAGAFVVLF
jgi:hypothetical protein